MVQRKKFIGMKTAFYTYQSHLHCIGARNKKAENLLRRNQKLATSEDFRRNLSAISAMNSLAEGIRSESIHITDNQQQQEKSVRAAGSAVCYLHTHPTPAWQALEAAGAVMVLHGTKDPRPFYLIRLPLVTSIPKVIS